MDKRDLSWLVEIHPNGKTALAIHVQAPFVVEEHMPATPGSAGILFDVVQNGGYQQLILEEGW
ncbi:MAG: hypothetical protein P8Y74_16880 [Desulfobacterales bacterium]